MDIGIHQFSFFRLTVAVAALGAFSAIMFVPVLFKISELLGKL
jgi:hypothetical protein